MAVRTLIAERMDMAVPEIRGDLTADELLEAQQEPYIELELGLARPYLWNATEGNVAATMTGGDMQPAATRSSVLWEKMAGGRTAILVARDSGFGMVRMLYKHAAGMPRKLGVFRDRDETIVRLLSPSGESDHKAAREGLTV